MSRSSDWPPILELAVDGLHAWPKAIFLRQNQQLRVNGISRDGWSFNVLVTRIRRDIAYRFGLMYRLAVAVG